MDIRQLLKNEALDLRLAAGARGTTNEIRWFAITEVDDVTRWVDGGELLLMTGLNITGQEEQQRRYIRNVHDSGISGLAFGTGIRHKTIPDPMIDEADKVGLPILEVPYEVPFIRITRAIFAETMTERQQVMQDALAVHERLAEAVVRLQDSLQTIMDIVSDELGIHLELRDTVTRHVLAESARRTRQPVSDEVLLSVTDSAFAIELRATKPARITDFDRQVLQHAKSAISFEFSRRHAVNVARLRLAGNLLSEIEGGRLSDAELHTRLGAFGVSPDANFGAFTIVDQKEDGERILRLLSRTLSDLGHSFIATTSARTVTMLVKLEDNDQAMNLALHFLKYAPRVKVGIGRVTSGLNLGLSITESRIAVTEGSDRKVSTYRDLNSIGPLLTVPEATLRMYIDDVLGEVANNPKLMDTLQAFTDHGGHWGQAAESLELHRHTLRYRVSQITAITGLDLDDPESRLQVWMAVKARETLNLRLPAKKHER